jgi:hypothetical protein
MIQTETNLDVVLAYLKINSDYEPHAQMLEPLVKAQMFHFRVWKEDNAIKGLRIFMKVLNPFQGAMGFALIEDFSNGYAIEPDLGLATSNTLPVQPSAV